MNAYIVSAYRTAVGKAPRGVFRFKRPDELGAAVIKKILSDLPDFDVTQIDDVMVGNATPEAEQGLNIGRMISLMGLDTDKVPGVTVNRYCSSGLETIAIASAKIHAGMADCIIAGGVECMSPIPFGGWRIVPNAAVAKKNPDYFVRNHIKLFKKEEEINPYAVNWKKIKDKTFPYKAVQEPGPHNSLGIVKLEFSNNYSVYIHDTPSKGLFNTIERTYSHGCVRCEGVIDLAKTILVADENLNLPDSLDNILSRQLNYTISLKKRIPIYLDYITVVARYPNQLIFLKDIYMKDEKLLQIIF